MYIPGLHRRLALVFAEVPAIGSAKL